MTVIIQIWKCNSLSFYTDNDSRSLSILVPASLAHTNVQRTARWNTFVPSGFSWETHTRTHTLSLCRRTANDGAQERREKNSSECMCDAIPDGAWYSEHPAKLKIDRINRVARTIHWVWDPLRHILVPIFCCYSVHFGSYLPSKIRTDGVFRMKLG